VEGPEIDRNRFYPTGRATRESAAGVRGKNPRIVWEPKGFVKAEGLCRAVSQAGAGPLALSPR